MHIALSRGTLRIASAVVAAATLVVGNGTASAAEPATPVDSSRAITQASAYGAYLFHNENGWHFRTHGTAEGTRFTAHLATNGTFHDVAAVRDEKDDHIKLDSAGHALDLSFATFSGVDGVDFRLDDAARLRVRIEADGRPLALDSIFLGDDGRHPAKNPFTVRLGDLHIPDNLQSGVTVRRAGDRLMLLTHNAEGTHAYTGTLTSTGTLEVVSLVRPEKDDTVSLSADGHTLTFKFATQEAVDGVVVRLTGAEKVKVSLQTDAAPTPLSAIHIGPKNRSPKHNPFSIRA